MTDIQPNTQITPETVTLYERAVMFATRDKPSTSYLQRRLEIGYNQAAGLIERMQEEGLISRPNSAGNREILVPYTDRPAASSPSADPFGPLDNSEIFATPTPDPSADHIGDATEKVDWERVGPKLVEAGAELADAADDFEGAAEPHRNNVRILRAIDAFRATLSLAQPQSNGDEQ